jgi:hypothetical protein
MKFLIGLPKCFETCTDKPVYFDNAESGGIRATSIHLTLLGNGIVTR